MTEPWSVAENEELGQPGAWTPAGAPRDGDPHGLACRGDDRQVAPGAGGRGQQQRAGKDTRGLGGKPVSYTHLTLPTTPYV